MDLTQLRYFKKLATLEHLTRAAEELYISQSTLSMSISRLESELEVSLFDRIGRGIRLNAFGKAFLEEAVEALVHIDRGSSDANNEAARAESSSDYYTDHRWFPRVDV